MNPDAPTVRRTNYTALQTRMNHVNTAGGSLITEQCLPTHYKRFVGVNDELDSNNLVESSVMFVLIISLIRVGLECVT